MNVSYHCDDHLEEIMGLSRGLKRAAHTVQSRFSISFPLVSKPSKFKRSVSIEDSDNCWKSQKFMCYFTQNSRLTQSKGDRETI